MKSQEFQNFHKEIPSFKKMSRMIIKFLFFLFIIRAYNNKSLSELVVEDFAKLIFN